MFTVSDVSSKTPSRQREQVLGNDTPSHSTGNYLHLFDESIIFCAMVLTNQLGEILHS